MKITSIKIEKLFDLFDYDISFTNEDNVLMITGANGFGKTMILNIIYNIFNRKFIFFQRLVFEKISINLDEHTEIIVSKKTQKDKPNVKFKFLILGEEVDSIEYSEKSENDLERSIRKYLPVEKMRPDMWMDHHTGRAFTFDGLINEYIDKLPEEVGRNLYRIKSEETNKILDSIQVHFIREQRLFRKVQIEDRNYREEKNQTIMSESIQTYAKELRDLITQNSRQSLRISQELDSSYPNRLITEKGKLAEEEYKTRFKLLKEKQDKLKRNGLYESKQEALEYSEDDSKALLVYLNDLEQKIGVFDALLEKLELFTSILNERRFTFKSIQIDKDKGFYFKTINGKELALIDLSSGEQHEVILLYELIFCAKRNTVVLIDEPELSLHITWQKEFLKDLIKIIKLQDMQVVIATHAPAIVNDRWDLVYTLEK